MELTSKLEALGFINFFTRRIGPCFQCEKTILTFYNIDVKRWYCEDCWYDTDFISELQLMTSEEKTVSETMEQRFARLEQALAQRDTEIAQLKSSRSDNCFIGSQSDNLTLKFRELSFNGWGVPTKAQNGQGYFRCSDFPFNFDVADVNGKPHIRVFTAIPVDSRQAQLFKERYMMQQIVQAKKRVPKDKTEAVTTTTQAFSPAPSTPSTPTPTTSTSASTFSSLPEAQRTELSRKADELVSMKLFANKLDALKSLLPQGVTFP